MNNITLMPGAIDEALDEMRRRSRVALYARDPEAWVADVLGKRWWSKQSEIAHSYLEHQRTAIKSANGTGKSFLVADLVCHYVTTHGLGDVIAIVSAPTLAQIELVVFAYLKENYGKAAALGVTMPGNINESLEWKAKTPAGILHMAVGRKPQDQDIVGSFQGIRRSSGTGVFIDEAGSVPRDLFVAAEAVTTGNADHKIVAIGNPDLRGTQFQDIFTNAELGKHWNLHTISAFDLPTFTGEVVYDDPEKQAAMLSSGMQDPQTVEVWRATWGEESARYQSKVLGEFPDEADNTFFSQSVINKALETEIDPEPGTPVVLGVDVALGGQDETKIYTNQAGKIRLHTTIQKMNEYDGAFAIHRIALETGAVQIRIDAAGTGHGVYTNLCSLPEFAGAPYTLVGIQGGHASPDRARWNNARSWHYDQLREQMLLGQIDLDLLDKELQKELMVQTFDYNNLGGIQITPKTEQRKKGLKSPDHLDAVIYSAIDLGYLEGPQAGDKIHTSAEDVLGDMPHYLQLMGRW